MKFEDCLVDLALTDIPNHTVIGIDIGSRQAKAVLLHNKEIYTVLIPTGFYMQECANSLIEDLLKQSGLKRSDVEYIVVTGYGRVSLKFDDIYYRSVTEIACHGMGAHYLGDDVHTIIDIGGQDSKAIRIDPKDGKVINFAMNDKCAAGTGRFLEKIAAVLGYDPTEMGPESLKSEKEIPISSTCVVFAESEVVSNRAKGVPARDIAAGIHKSVAKRVNGLLQRVGIESNVLFTGGVSNNIGMLKAFEDLLGIKIAKTKLNTVYAGCLGAAVYAANYAEKGLKSETSEQTFSLPELDLDSLRKTVEDAKNNYINHTAGKKKYVAYTCTYTPLELLASANVAYYRLMERGTPEEISTGETITQSMFCDINKSIIGGFMKGKPEYKATEKVYTFFACACMRSTVDGIRNLFCPAEIYNLNKTLHDEDGIRYLEEQIQFFRKDLESITGEVISDEVIVEKIRLFKKARRILTEISSYRKAAVPLISSSVFRELTSAYYVVPVEQLIPELEKILSQLKNFAQLNPAYKTQSSSKIKIMISGGIIADGDNKIISILEKQLGVDIVAEDNCTGIKPLYIQIPEEGNNPINNLAKGYYNKAPCGRMIPIDEMMEHSLKTAQEYKADGVILYYLKFCPCYSLTVKQYSKLFEEKDIPIYSLSGDYSTGDEGQIKTRLEAFIEMLKEKHELQVTGR